MQSNASVSFVPVVAFTPVLCGTPALQGVRVTERKAGEDHGAPIAESAARIPYSDAIIARDSNAGPHFIAEHAGRLFRVRFASRRERNIAHRMWLRQFDRSLERGDVSVSVWPRASQRWPIAMFFGLFGGLTLVVAIAFFSGPWRALFTPTHSQFPAAVAYIFGVFMGLALCALGATHLSGPHIPFRAAITSKGLVVLDDSGERNYQWSSVRNWKRSHRGGVEIELCDGAEYRLNGPQCVATIPLLLKFASHAGRIRRVPVRRMCIVGTLTGLVCAAVLYYLYGSILPGAVPGNVATRQVLMLALFVPSVCVVGLFGTMVQKLAARNLRQREHRERAQAREVWRGFRL